MYTHLEHRVRRNITTHKGICQLYTRAIGTNVCPAVGRLVDCASNREIILRYRNPVTTTPQPPPRAPLASLYPFHYFISCWIEPRLSVMHWTLSQWRLIEKRRRDPLLYWFSFISLCWRKFARELETHRGSLSFILSFLFLLSRKQDLKITGIILLLFGLINHKCKLLNCEITFRFWYAIIKRCYMPFCDFLSWWSYYRDHSWYYIEVLLSTSRYLSFNSDHLFVIRSTRVESYWYVNIILCSIFVCLFWMFLQYYKFMLKTYIM